MLRTTLFAVCSIAFVSLVSCGPSARNCVGDNCSDDDGSGGSNGSGSGNGSCTYDPGAYDIPGDGIDNDCDGIVDNPPGPCDSGLGSNSTDPSDFAKAIDICQVSSNGSWGLVSATYTSTDGTSMPEAQQHYIGSEFGPGVMPKEGAALGSHRAPAPCATTAAKTVGPTTGESADGRRHSRRTGSSANGGTLAVCAGLHGAAFGNGANEPDHGDAEDQGSRQRELVLDGRELLLVGVPR